MKNLKMHVIISICVSFIAFICLLVLAYSVNRSVSSAIEKKVVDNMCSTVEGQANVIEVFVNEQAVSMRVFASSNEVAELLKNPDDPARVRAAQNYVEKFFSYLNDWEGIYISDWNTKVLAHSSVGAVGMVTRTGDALEPYRATMTQSSDGFFNGGAFKSPASGQFIINLRMAIYDEDKNPIGLVGGGPFLSGMNGFFEDTKISGIDNMEFVISDVSDGLYTYHSNADLLAQPVEDKNLLDIIKTVTSGGAESGTVYVEKSVIVYKYLPAANLILTMKCSIDDVLSDSKEIAGTTLVFIIITFVMTLLATVVTSIIITRPLNKVKDAVNNIGELSLVENEAIKPYVNKRSEIGQISTSVHSLTNNISAIISTLSDCTDSLNDGANFMMKSMHSLVECTNDNNKTTMELYDNISATTDIIQKTAEDIENIYNIMQENKSANKERINIADGMINDINDLTDTINSRAEQTEQDIEISMSYLHALTDINEKVKKIQNIASETNILAINASIEASRAGEAGKCFAVVANQIKSLALNSTKAADEIYNICTEMNNNIVNIEKCFRGISEFIKLEITESFVNFKDIFGNLKKSMDEADSNSEKMADITDSMRQETVTFYELVNKNKLGIEDITEKTKTTYSMTKDVQALIEQNIQAAKDIDQIVKKFNTGKI